MMSRVWTTIMLKPNAILQPGMGSRLLRLRPLRLVGMLCRGDCCFRSRYCHCRTIPAKARSQISQDSAATKVDCGSHGGHRVPAAEVLLILQVGEGDRRQKAPLTTPNPGTALMPCRGSSRMTQILQSLDIADPGYFSVLPPAVPIQFLLPARHWPLPSIGLPLPHRGSDFPLS